MNDAYDRKKSEISIVQIFIFRILCQNDEGQIRRVISITSARINNHVLTNCQQNEIEIKINNFFL